VIDSRTVSDCAYMATGVAIGSQSVLKGVFVFCWLLGSWALIGIVKRRFVA
jgi:hypothetical protein